jgi:hypothetical protein
VYHYQIAKEIVTPSSESKQNFSSDSVNQYQCTGDVVARARLFFYEAQRIFKDVSENNTFKGLFNHLDNSVNLLYSNYTQSLQKVSFWCTLRNAACDNHCLPQFPSCFHFIPNEETYIPFETVSITSWDN